MLGLTVHGIIAFVEVDCLHGADVIVRWSDIGSSELFGKVLRCFVEIVVECEFGHAVCLSLFIVSVKRLFSEELEGISQSIANLWC